MRERLPQPGLSFDALQKKREEKCFQRFDTIAAGAMGMMFGMHAGAVAAGSVGIALEVAAQGAFTLSMTTVAGITLPIWGTIGAGIGMAFFAGLVIHRTHQALQRISQG